MRRALSEGPDGATPQAVADALTGWPGGLCVTAHHNPDADALGSMLAAGRALSTLGLDVVLAHPDPDPVPVDLAFLVRAGEAIAAELPPDIGDRLLLCLDCASEQRLWHEPVHRRAGGIVNVDHHGDNTRFGHLNLIAPQASSTAEVLVRVLDAAGCALDESIATPLFAALVTDTGRFGYDNSGAEAHRLAARLIEAGADPAALAGRLYEEQPYARALLLGRALTGSRLAVCDRLLVAVLDESDYEAADGDDTEGIVEALRAVRGVRVAALMRPAGGAGRWRVSVRSADSQVDVSAIARELGGGGHRAAAGFSTTMLPDELVPWIEERVRQALHG